MVDFVIDALVSSVVVLSAGFNTYFVFEPYDGRWERWR